MNTIEQYNQVLNFCRTTWQRKQDIQLELGISANRLTTMLRRLTVRKLLEARHPSSAGRIYEYKTFEGAVYTQAVRAYPAKISQPQSQGIKREGNVTTVSSNGYHTKGTTPKRSVWIGSSADNI